MVVLTLWNVFGEKCSTGIRDIYWFRFSYNKTSVSPPLQIQAKFLGEKGPGLASLNLKWRWHCRKSKSLGISQSCWAYLTKMLDLLLIGKECQNKNTIKIRYCPQAHIKMWYCQVHEIPDEVLPKFHGSFLSNINCDRQSKWLYHCTIHSSNIIL